MTAVTTIDKASGHKDAPLARTIRGLIAGCAVFGAAVVGAHVFSFAEARVAPVWTDQNWSLTRAGSDLILQGGYTVARSECRLVTFAWKLSPGVVTKGWGKGLGQLYGREVYGDKVNIGPILFATDDHPRAPVVSADVTYACGEPWVLHQHLGPVAIDGSSRVLTSP